MRLHAQILAVAGLAAATQAYDEPHDFDPKQALAARGISFDQFPGQVTFSDVSNEEEQRDCDFACNALRSLHQAPNTLLLQSEEGYEAGHGDYWSQQQQGTRPACFFRPKTTDDVAAAVLLAREARCPFAVKSGGHAAFQGASSVEGGITILLEEMNEFTVADDRKSVALGPGNKWLDVYTKLDKLELKMIGGRVSAIGVGGLTLGGGISFFSHEHGWAADNIISYEVVTAAGEIVTASVDSHPDLFWALRGGGNNFGIVTKFVAKTWEHPGGKMWGGVSYYPAAFNQTFVKALVKYGKEGVLKDNKAGAIVNLCYVQQQDAWVIPSILDYSEVLPEGKTHPEVLDDFYTVPHRIEMTPIYQTETLANLTRQLNDTIPLNMRQSYWTQSTILEENMAQDVMDVMVDVITPIRESVAALIPCVALQVIPVSMLKSTARNGGNPLGLENEDRPLLNINWNAMWALPQDDEAVLGAFRTATAEINKRAKKVGLDHPFMYMNYASKEQEVVAGYGEKNVKRLKEISKKYDPTGVFQKLQPGYFKLPQ